MDPNAKELEGNLRRVPIPVKYELKRNINKLEAMSGISNMVVARKHKQTQIGPRPSSPNQRRHQKSLPYTHRPSIRSV